MTLILKKEGSAIKLVDDSATVGYILSVGADGTIASTENVGGSGISDAPSDGSSYVRKDATWIVNAGGGLTQAQIRRLL
ncbi:MAG: hypothetical protein IPL84_03820 [Chitinophagaceae bacterium]|nr:hypothetical protein [Chitinophagaceae bacterium]